MGERATKRQMRETIDILWYTLSRDQKVWADEDLQLRGLPEVERGYRQPAARTTAAERGAGVEG